MDLRPSRRRWQAIPHPAPQLPPGPPASNTYTTLAHSSLPSLHACAGHAPLHIPKHPICEHSALPSPPFLPQRSHSFATQLTTGRARRRVSGASRHCDGPQQRQHRQRCAHDFTTPSVLPTRRPCFLFFPLPSFHFVPRFLSFDVVAHVLPTTTDKSPFLSVRLSIDKPAICQSR